MASFIGAFILAYLFSASFTDTVQLNVSPVQKLVDYEYNMNFTEILPGTLYNGSIIAHWAVPQTAIAGLEGKAVEVKVTASVDGNSSVFFPTLSGVESKESTVYLKCIVQSGQCTNDSVLSAEIPILASIKPDASSAASISLTSEISGDTPISSAQDSAGDLITSFKNAFLGNGSNESIPNASAAAQGENGSFGIPQIANLSADQDFLDSLKPEGNSSDPVGFLKQNPLITLTALVIVIIITGAYLLKSKD